jgi:tRNA threonylcarbamoyladenosine biosynthesis protein TsaB
MPAAFSLVLETSTPHGSLAIVGPESSFELREFRSDRGHNAVLFSPLQELLDSRGDSKIELVIVGSGPGSYSGTRVGIAAAQGVAIASSCPAVAIPSILAVPSAQNGASCLAIGDARRGSYWTAQIAESNLLHEPELTDAAGLETIVRKFLSAGLAVFAFEEPARFPLPAELSQQVRMEFPDAERLWQAWKSAKATSREQWIKAPPQPMYLKPPHITPAKRSHLLQP